MFCQIHNYDDFLWYIFPCIFININIGCDIQQQKKKHFNCLQHQRYIHDDSNHSLRPVFWASIQCSIIPKFIHMPPATRFHQPLHQSDTSSPNSVSSPAIYSSFVFEKNNTQTTASMSPDSSSSSSETTMSSNSSSVLSKASLKLFRIYIQIPLTIFYFVLLKF